MNKTETALLYFPDSTPKVAVRHLMRWIARCAPLLHALEATGYWYKIPRILPQVSPDAAAVCALLLPDTFPIIITL